jgi:hypothetical protein
VAGLLLSGAALVGCHDDHGGGSTSPSPQGTNFSTLTQEIFVEGADTTPINFDKLTIIYDVNDDPTAFDGLLT